MLNAIEMIVKVNVVGIESMAKLTDTQKDEGSDSFVSFVITIPSCRDPWFRLVRYISMKLTLCSCMRYSKTVSSIDYRSNERATRTAGEDTDSFVSARFWNGETGRALQCKSALNKNI